MKTKTKVILSIILLAVVLTMSFMVFEANATAAPNPVDVGQGDSSVDVGGVTKIGNQVITIISTGGSIISVIVLVILGVKYMMGSAEEKAEYKKTLMPYVIGAALVFAASAIAGIIFTVTQNIGG